MVETSPRKSKVKNYRETLLQTSVIRIGWVPGCALAVPTRSVVARPWHRVGNGIARWQERAAPLPDFGMGIGEVYDSRIAMPARRNLVIGGPTGGVPTGKLVVVNAVSRDIYKDCGL